MRASTATSRGTRMTRQNLVLGLLAMGIALELAPPHCSKVPSGASGSEAAPPSVPSLAPRSACPPPAAGSTPAQPSIAERGQDSLAASLTFDPYDSRYDPALINRASAPRALFEREPRVAGFAIQRERELDERIRARLAARIGVNVSYRVECRASSCELLFDSQLDDATANLVISALDLTELADAAQLGGASSQSGESRPGLSVVLLFSATQRDEVVYAERLHVHKQHDEDQVEE